MWTKLNQFLFRIFFISKIRKYLCNSIISDEKSPSKRKDSIFVKHSMNITSTPHGKKIEKQTSNENTGNK